MNQYEQIQIQYVNPRQGNRPPSIKDGAGQFYTVSDAAIGMFSQGAQGTIGYYINQRGYRVAVEWNGQELPKGPQGQRAGGMQQAGQAAPHVQHPQQSSPPQQHVNEEQKSEAIFVTGVVQQAMSSGKFGLLEIRQLTRETVLAWRERNQPISTGMPSGDPGPDNTDSQGPYIDDGIPFA